jgi:flagellar hook-associated protein 2
VQLVDQLDAGSNVTYLVKGAAADAVSSSRSLQLATGLTVDLKKADPAVEVSVEVKRGTSSVQTALKTFVTAYNAIIDEFDKHRGENKGALSGEGVVSSLSSALAEIAVWDSGTAGIGSLAELGVLVGRDGKLALDDADFALATKDNVTAVAAFLGSATTGGFLKMATDQLKMIVKDHTGILSAAQETTDAAVKSQDNRVEAEQTRIDDLRTSLQEQLARADALIASLEQQATYINSMFEAMRMASEGMR